ncbi:MAG TPA: anti-sigma factor RsbA family regulatory protein [Pseudonocardiaceae bacterium]|nr:anti-sigma factor RsbA family regulatory protein [Pseudonocardiaceae bacterium]
MTAPAPRRADQFEHPALLYRGTAEYLAGTVPFIREGLAAGEPVGLAVPGPNLRLILTELGSDAERVRLLDMTRSGRHPGRIIPNVLRAFADSHSSGRVRIVAEQLWAGRNVREYPTCAHQETLINVALSGRLVSMLCPYDADVVGPHTLADVELNHPRLIDARGDRTSTRYAGERVITDDRLCSHTMGPSFTFDATRAPLAGQFACDQATRLGHTGDHAELKLIIGELVARTLVHGGGTGSLRIWAERGYLVCDVRHAGHIRDLTGGSPLADPRKPDGRGLLMVHHLSDLVQHHSCPQGTTTRVYLKLSAAEELPRDPGEPALAPPRIRTTAPAGPTPLPWQTYEALHAAERFGRYLPQDAVTEPQRLTTVNSERRHIEPVLEALSAVEALARVVDRWRARLVRLARTRGAPWTDIGQSLGVSKQAAHERYGRARGRRPSGSGLAGRVGPLPPVQGT